MTDLACRYLFSGFYYIQKNDSSKVFQDSQGSQINHEKSSIGPIEKTYTNLEVLNMS